MTSLTLLESVRAANQEIKEFLQREQAEVSHQPDLTQYYPQIMSLSVRLQEVGQKLQEPSGRREDGQRELCEYADNLQSLRDALQSVTVRLMERRSGLEIERKRLQGISRWIADVKGTDPASSGRHSSLSITAGD
jgi:hypothetical protein